MGKHPRERSGVHGHASSQASPYVSVPFRIRAQLVSLLMPPQAASRAPLPLVPLGPLFAPPAAASATAGAGAGEGGAGGSGAAKARLLQQLESQADTGTLEGCREQRGMRGLCAWPVASTGCGAPAVCLATQAARSMRVAQAVLAAAAGDAGAGGAAVMAMTTRRTRAC